MDSYIWIVIHHSSSAVHKSGFVAHYALVINNSMMPRINKLYLCGIQSVLKTSWVPVESKLIGHLSSYAGYKGVKQGLLSGLFNK